MNGLAECKTCNKTVEKTAKTCPHCGASNPAIKKSDIIGGLVIFFIITIITVVLVKSCGAS